MRKILIVFSALVLSLAGCDKSGSGGEINSGGSSSNSGDSPSNSGKYKVILTSDKQTVRSGGSDLANITITITDENNNLVTAEQSKKENLLRAVTVNNGGLLRAGDSYLKRVLEATKDVPQDRKLVVNAFLTDGSNGNMTLSIGGFSLSVNSPAPTTSQINTNLIVPVTVVDALGNPAQNQNVAADVSGNQVDLKQTDVAGVASLVIPGSKFTTVGQSVSVNINLPGDASQIITLPIVVTAANQDIAQFTAPAQNALLPISQSHTVTLDWPSTLSSSVTVGSTLSGVVFNPTSPVPVNGNRVSFTVNSANPGQAAINVTGGGKTVSRDVVFVPTAPDRIVLDAAPTKVFTSGDGDVKSSTTTLTATVTSTNSNVGVPSQTVRFSKSNLGSFLPSSGVVLTDRSGKATVKYIAGTSAGNNQITASVDGTSLTANKTITAVKPKLTIRAGTGNLVTETGNGKTALKAPYRALINNGSGSPAVGARVKVTATTVAYAYGNFSAAAGSTGGSVSYTKNVAKVCHAELDDSPKNDGVDAAEDDNGNGVLDPGLPVVLNAITGGSGSTASGELIMTVGSTGVIEFEMEYLKSYADWAIIKLDIIATQGSAESRFEKLEALTGLAADYKKPGLPQYVSPYFTDIKPAQGQTTVGNCNQISSGTTTQPDANYFFLLSQ